MRLIQAASRSPITAALVLMAAVIVAPAQVVQAADKAPSGLQQVDRFDVTAAFVRPDTDFSAYDRVMFIECSTAFVKGWQERVNRRRKPNERVTDQDLELMKADLSQRFQEVFVEEFTTRGGYELAQKEAKGVLLVRPAVFDVDLAAPRNSKGLFLGTSQTEGAGAASLFIELYDASTGTLLARMIDRRTIRDAGVTQVAGRNTNSLGMRKQLTFWARKVLEGVEDLQQNPVT